MSEERGDRLPDGVTVGHWHDRRARTGCTVVLLPAHTRVGGEVRGGAPASREMVLVEATRTVSCADALVLTGGSAFGLGVSDGVMAWLAERGRGVVTSAGVVPIVPTLALFDLAVGDSRAWPGPEQGVAACEAASSWPSVGAVGAGCGATVGTWLGAEHRRDAGLGLASVSEDGVMVSAIAAVNAFGDRRDRAAADLAAGHRPVEPELGSERTNTTLVAVITDAELDPLGLHRVAVAGHDGLARALEPAHTAADGDGVLVAATGAAGPVGSAQVARLAAAAVERAIVSVLT